MAGGHWNDTGIGRSAAQRCVDSIVFHVLLHLCVCLVMGTSALALRSRGAILGDPLCWAEHSNPHQFAVLLCHWTGTTSCSNQTFTLFHMSTCQHWEFLQFCMVRECRLELQLSFCCSHLSLDMYHVLLCIGFYFIPIVKSLLQVDPLTTALGFAACRHICPCCAYSSGASSYSLLAWSWS